METQATHVTQAMWVILATQATRVAQTTRVPKATTGMSHKQGATQQGYHTTGVSGARGGLETAQAHFGCRLDPVQATRREAPIGLHLVTDGGAVNTRS